MPFTLSTWGEGDLPKVDSISLFSKIGDKGVGGVKYLKMGDVIYGWPILVTGLL